jgi:hypothetical protein
MGGAVAWAAFNHGLRKCFRTSGLRSEAGAGRRLLPAPRLRRSPLASAPTRLYRFFRVGSVQDHHARSVNATIAPQA